MATTTNFGWETPDDTDLVKDGAAAIRTALGGVDTSFVDLKGGTTGQILSKASNTDLDFVWTADAGAPTSYGYAAGKNKIINGAFDVWQRGTSLSSPAVNSYTADRFYVSYDGTGATRTVSRETFTPGTAPVAGYEGNYFYRYATTVAGSGNTYNTFLAQKIENVTTLAGQTATLSFWGKANTSKTVSYNIEQSFGSGGSGAVSTGVGTFSFTSSWQRFSVTVSIPSISGKTIGANSYLLPYLYDAAGGVATYDIWGFQLEAGSVATAFQTATGTLQGELAACQRYYYRNAATANAFNNLGTGTATSTTNTQIVTPFPVSMRVAPTSVDYSTLAVQDGVTRIAVTSLSLGTAHNMPDRATVFAVVASGLTQYRLYFLEQNNNTAGYLGFSAEL